MRSSIIQIKDLNIHPMRLVNAVQGWGSGHLLDRLAIVLTNALCESFFATLECELITRHRFPNHSQAKLAIFEYIEGWYKSTSKALCDKVSIAHHL